MHWINIGIILVSILNLGFAILLYSINPKNKINITFSIAILLVAAWSFGMAMFREAQTEQMAWCWTWLQNGAGALIVIPFYLFCIYFPFQNLIIKKWQMFLMAVSIITVMIVVIVPGAWIKKVITNPPNNDYIYGYGYWGLAYFNLFFYGYVLLGFNNLLKKYKNSQGFIRKQLFYILIATIIITIGSLFSALMPLIRGSLGPYWLGPYFSLPTIFIITYFIYRKD